MSRIILIGTTGLASLALFHALRDSGIEANYIEPMKDSELYEAELLKQLQEDIKMAERDIPYFSTAKVDYEMNTYEPLPRPTNVKQKLNHKPMGIRGTKYLKSHRKT